MPLNIECSMGKLLLPVCWNTIPGLLGIFSMPAESVWTQEPGWQGLHPQVAQIYATIYLLYACKELNLQILLSAACFSHKLACSCYPTAWMRLRYLNCTTQKNKLRLHSNGGLLNWNNLLCTRNIFEEAALFLEVFTNGHWLGYFIREALMTKICIIIHITRVLN